MRNFGDLLPGNGLRPAGALGHEHSGLVDIGSYGVVSISASQLGYLLDAIDWRNPQHTWRPRAAG